MPPSFSLPDDTDRLAELGRIAGGLVHELKNPLGVMLLNAELLQGQLQALPEAERPRFAHRLERIVASGRTLQDTVQAFLAFARPARPDPEAIDLNALLRALLDEQEEHLRRDVIAVASHADPMLPQVAGDRVHLGSVFRNVLVNAREALRERTDDRRILVVTRGHASLAKVMIANNGPPLPDRVAAHLFEPFVSGKEDGTGLGLAIVKRLVEMHHGTIAVSSDPDQGVSFTFEFPTTLGPALAPTELPMPSVEATVRARPRRSRPRGQGSGARGQGEDRSPPADPGTSGSP